MAKVELRALVGRLNTACKTALEQAASICVAAGHREVTVEHFLVALLEQPGTDIRIVLQAGGISPNIFLEDVRKSFERFKSGNGQAPVFSTPLIELLQDAWMVASVDLSESAVRGGAVLLALMQDSERFARFEYITHLDALSTSDIRRRFSEITKGSVETQAASPQGRANSGGEKPELESALAKYAHCFTEAARKGQIDPVFCRDEEIRQMVDILARRRKNNPICVGEAGVGKTAVVEGLALRIVEGDVPESLKDAELWGLDLGALQAGASVKGEFEKRLKGVLDEVKHADRQIILFIDEAHTLIGAGGQAGGSDAANLLKPALARGEIKTIAATTWSEYKKYFEKDPALTRRFQLVSLGEPTVEQARLIIHGLIPSYEKAHGVYITDTGATAAAQLSARYITGRQLPDKAIDVLDTACARVKASFTGIPAAIDRLKREQQVLQRDKESGFLSDDMQPRLTRLADMIVETQTRRETLEKDFEEQKSLAERLRELRDREDKGESAAVELADLRQAFDTARQYNSLVSLEVGKAEVAAVIGDWTGVPVSSMSQNETAKLLTLAETIGKSLRGQNHALRLVEEQLQTSRLDLQRQERPLGVFLFVGPSGIGKTETGLEVARKLFGGEQFLTTINMTEYQERHSLARLIGSPPGYVGYGEGGILTEAIRKKPYSVVLLDEVEKADPGVLNLFYQAFDKGEMADGEGRKIDCKNVVFFLTSNLASDMIEQMTTEAVEKGEEPNPDKILEEIRPYLNNHFKPALIARMRVIVYLPLGDTVMAEIIDAKLKDLQARLDERHGLTFAITDTARKFLCEQCIQAASGARLIDQILQRRLVPQIAKKMLEANVADERLTTVTIDLGENRDFAFAFETRGSSSANPGKPVLGSSHTENQRDQDCQEGPGNV